MLLFTAIVAVIGGAAWLEVRNYLAIRDGALATLTQRAAAIAQAEGAAFAVTDTALRSVVAEQELLLQKRGLYLDPHSETEVMRAHLGALAGALPQVSGLALIDAEGRMSMRLAAGAGSENFSQSLEIQVGDRDYFRWFSSGPGATDPSLAPFVGQPLRSRLDGAWFLGMSRPMQGPDGAFAGIALAIFSLDWFDRLNQHSILPPETSLILYSRQGTVVDAILPGPVSGDRAVGRPLEVILPTEDVEQLRRRAADTPTPVAAILEDGLAAVAPLPDAPLQVMVFRPWDAVLAEWWRQVMSDAGFLMLTLFSLLALAVPLVRALRDRDRLFALSPDPVCVCDGDGRIQRANGAWVRLLDYPMTEIVGRRHTDLVHPDDTEKVLRAQAQLLGGEPVEDVSIRYLRADGRSVWLAWSGAAEGARMFILAHDITQRRAAEEALRDSEQRFRDISEAASEFIWELSPDGRLAFVSRRVRTVLGASPDDLRGRRLGALFTAEGGATLEAALRRGAPFVIEVPARQGDGEIWLRLSGRPVRQGLGGEGALTGYRGAAQDITESRLARQALQDSEARYRGIVNTIVDAIVTIDESGIIRSVNPAAERLFGYAAREMIGGNVCMLMPEPYRSQHDGYLRSYLRTGMARAIGIGREVEALRKDGSVFAMELGLSEVFIGRQRFFIGACRDVSERKRVEKLKDEFVATVSHELRTPLTAIRGALGLMAGGVAGALPQQAGALVMTALANCDRLSSLVDDILDIEGLENGGKPLRRLPVDLRQVVMSVLTDLAPAMETANVRSALEPETGVPLMVVGDEGRLGQTVANLVSNAIKFSPPEGVIRLALGQSDGHAVLTVTDQGPGIPDDFHGRIFERFSQADGSSTRGQSGTGLGLAIVRAIVEAHDGEVSFTTVTEPPTGTTFKIRLPLRNEPKPIAVAGTSEERL